MRLIDADAYSKKVCTYNETGCGSCNVQTICPFDEPTIDAVPVIRCKDCKYYNPQQHYCEGIGNWFGYDGEWSDNGYCYKAERKEE